MRVINCILKKALFSLAEIIAEQHKKNYLSNYIPVHNHVVQALGQKIQLHKNLCYAGHNLANYSVQLPTCSYQTSHLRIQMQNIKNLYNGFLIK